MHRAPLCNLFISTVGRPIGMCFAGSEGSVISAWDIATFNTGQDYSSFVMSNCGTELMPEDHQRNQTITGLEVISTGMVGTSTVTITTIFDYLARVQVKSIHSD